MADDVLHSVRTDVEILKKDVSNIQGLLSRIDSAIDKIADASNGISRILAVHDNQIKDNEYELKERKRLFEKEAELLHKRISEKDAEQHMLVEKHHKDLMTFLEDHDVRSRAAYEELSNRVVALERWKWIVIGGSSILGWLVAESGLVSKFLT
jgi:predicted  nucleic acid-binding Zn-ribbon protein